MWTGMSEQFRWSMGSNINQTVGESLHRAIPSKKVNEFISWNNTSLVKQLQASNRNIIFENTFETASTDPPMPHPIPSLILKTFLHLSYQETHKLTLKKNFEPPQQHTKWRIRTGWWATAAWCRPTTACRRPPVTAKPWTTTPASRTSARSSNRSWTSRTNRWTRPRPESTRSTVTGWSRCCLRCCARSKRKQVSGKVVFLCVFFFFLFFPLSTGLVLLFRNTQKKRWGILSGAHHGVNFFLLGLGWCNRSYTNNNTHKLRGEGAGLWSHVYMWKLFLAPFSGILISSWRRPEPLYLWAHFKWNGSMTWWQSHG